MFHSIEKHRTLAQIIMGIIGVSFMTFGLVSFQTRPDNNYIVKIGDHAITRTDLEQAIRNTEAAGGQANREAVFQTLVQNAYLMEGAKKLGIVISDNQIKQMIVDTPEFQTDGKFDQSKFQQFLTANYANEQAFMNEQRTHLLSLTMQQLLNSSVIADAPALQALNTIASPRTVRTNTISPQAFVDKVKVSDSELKKFYDANKKNYALPQGVKYEYVILSAKNLAAKQSVSDDEVKKAFDEAQSSLKAKRQIAHIFWAAPKTADAATREKAKTEAEKVLAELKVKPEQFAELAKKYSQDVGSANNGGVLGEFAQDGSVGSKQLEDAAFALKEGEISSVVESDAGYHIARVTGISTVDFDSQKETIRKQLQEKKAQPAYTKLLEELGELAFATPDKLQPAADKLGVTLQKQDEWLTRANASSLNVPQAVVDALFSEEVFAKKHNSEPISVNGATWFVRATETRNESTEPFEQVKTRVQEDFVRSESLRLAREHGAALVKDLQAGKASLLAWTQATDIDPRKFRQQMPEAVYNAMIKAIPRDGKPAYALLDFGDAPSIIEVQSIKSMANDTQALANIKTELTMLKGDALANAYIALLQKEIPTKQGAEKISDE